MKYVIGVIYLIEDNIDIDLTCQVLQDAIGYSNHKINTGELYCPYWQVCEKLVSEGIMRRTKDPLVYVLRKEEMKRLEKWEKIAQNLTDHVSEPAVLLRIVNSDFADLGDNDKILVVMFLCGVINQDNKTLGRYT